MIINRFGDLNRRIYLYGTSKKLELKKEEEITPLPFVIMPESKLKIIWNFVIIALLTYTATFVPYSAAFIDNPTEAQSDFEWLVDVLFIIDLFVNLLSAYEDEDKNIEVRLGYIVRNYIKSWFLLDLTACIPY